MERGITRRDFIKALAALAGVTVAARFDNRLGSMARALSGPQEWVLSFDEREMTKLIQKSTTVRSVFPYKVNERGHPVVECTLEFETAYLWALATLTGPDGDEWRTVDGENWTCEDRRMIL